MNGNETAVRLNQNGYQGVLVQCSGIFMPTPETIKISPYRYLLKQDSREKKTIFEIKRDFIKMKARKMCYEIQGSYLREKMNFLVADIVYMTHHPKGSVFCIFEVKKQNVTGMEKLLFPMILNNCLSY